MQFRYTRHFTREEADALLPEIEKWLARLDRCKTEFRSTGEKLDGLMKTGQDLGGGLVNRHVRAMAGVGTAIREFHRRGILLKDAERGLVDFPAIRDGREVFLCWQRGEERVAFWHDLDAGYAGREPL
jgi:hypothetical protein